MNRLPLLAAPIPALIGSLLVMHSAEVGRTLLLQQVLVFCAAAAGCAFALARARPFALPKNRHWIIGMIVVLLLLPVLVSPAEEPRRWLSLGSFRLYVSALLLPATLLLLTAKCRATESRAWWPVAAGVAIAVVLTAQPDASQVTAFALAFAACTLRVQAGALIKVGTLIALANCVVIAWSRPDPLTPVPYVEGVLDLARSISPLAMVVVIAAITLIPACLIWHARSRQNFALFAVAIYYLVIFFLACLQFTPMPILGFGAGPILGYFAMLFVASIDDPAKSA